MEGADVEAHFRALRRALRAKRVATISDLSLLLASDGAALPAALDLLVQAAAGDRRAVELALVKLQAMVHHVPQSTTPGRAVSLVQALERLTATN